MSEMREVYLDNSATTRVFPEVAQLMTQIMLEEYGNPSSMHHKGVEAEREIAKAQKILAGLLKVKERNLIFTSCGSESDNLAIIGAATANARRGKHLITTQIEHPAVIESMRFLEAHGFEVTYLPVDANGIVTAQQVADAVREDTVLVSIMHVNNEIGSVMPVAEIGEAIKKKNRNTLFHVDAVQSFTKYKIYPGRMHIDLLAVSGHKIHAAKGMGMLYAADGVKLNPTVLGGGQQGGLRSGTQNVPGIAGMALAAQMLYKNFDEDVERLYSMRESFVSGVSDIDNIVINGKPGKESAPHIISVTVPGVRAEVLLHALEEKGVYVSSGSACSTNRPHLSATLQAIGVARENLDSTIRISLSVMNTQEDIDTAVSAMKEIIPFLRKYTRY